MTDNMIEAADKTHI